MFYLCELSLKSFFYSPVSFRLFLSLSSDEDEPRPGNGNGNRWRKRKEDPLPLSVHPGQDTANPPQSNHDNEDDDKTVNCWDEQRNALEAGSNVYVPTCAQDGTFQTVQCYNVSKETLNLQLNAGVNLN